MRLIVGARIMGMRRASSTAYGRESIAAMNRRVKASRNHPNGTNPTLRINHETPHQAHNEAKPNHLNSSIFRFTTDVVGKY